MHLNYVLLFVKNPIESGAFYSRLLGIEPLEQSPTFVLFGLPNGIMLGLWSSATAEPPVLAKAGGSEIAFSVKEVDALHDRWVQLGVPMAQKPTDMDFGRTFVALDPDGHRIRAFRMWEEKV